MSISDKFNKDMPLDQLVETFISGLVQVGFSPMAIYRELVSHTELFRLMLIKDHHVPEQDLNRIAVHELRGSDDIARDAGLRGGRKK